MKRWKRIGLSIALSLAANAVLWLAYGHVVRQDVQKPQTSGVTWEHLKGEKIGFYTPDRPISGRPASALSAKEGGPHEQE